MGVIGIVFMKEEAQAWNKKWLNLGKVRIVYTTCQVSQYQHDESVVALSMIPHSFGLVF